MNSIVSIIVPIYNAEKYLDKTIDSIISQTYKDLEIILVDDGSKDKSLEICNKYKEIDSRIKVFHKENGGVSSARNLGLDKACGEYVSFCDSDDILVSNMIEKLVNTIQETNVSMVSCGVIVTKKNKKKYVSVGENKYFDVTNSEDLDKTLFSPEFIVSSVCNKIFVREKIGNIRFVEGVSWGEDQTFIEQFLLKNNKFYCIKDCLYYYDRDNSILSIKIMRDRIKKSTIINFYQDEFLKNLGVKDKTIWNKFYWIAIKSLFAGMGNEKKYNSLDLVKLHLNEALEKDYLKEAIKNFEPHGILQQLVYKCVKNRKIKLAHLILTIKKMVKG